MCVHKIIFKRGAGGELCRSREGYYNFSKYAVKKKNHNKKKAISVETAHVFLVEKKC